MKRFILCFLFGVVLPLPVFAVIISGGDGSGNTTAPVDDPGWANVGRVNTAYSSATYLGSSWFITAYHVRQLDNPTSVILGSGSYSINPTSWTRLSNGGIDADLVMFRVTSEPVESDVALRTASINGFPTVTMIGDGRNRAAGKTYWDASWNETTEGLATYTGYKWAAGATKRWGENTVAGKNLNVDSGFGTTVSFSTSFDSSGGVNEAQGATYDSGGGVFIKNGLNWELAGIMITISTYGDGPGPQPDQPASTAVYGNLTYVADLTKYHAQITSTMAIPEPTSFALLALMFGAAAVGRKLLR